MLLAATQDPQFSEFFIRFALANCTYPLEFTKVAVLALLKVSLESNTPVVKSRLSVEPSPDPGNKLGRPPFRIPIPLNGLKLVGELVDE
jgi:hypothetical protein